MIFKGKTNEVIELKTLEANEFKGAKDPDATCLTVLWFKEDGSELVIDGKPHTFAKNQIVFLTEFHNVEVVKTSRINYVRFNRSFYCVIDHDEEVGCKGLLFFGSSKLPIIKLPEGEEEHFETLWKMFSLEMKLQDNLQVAMLQMMLKRYLILCTRVYKIQEKYPDQVEELDIVREFNFLVEQHFRTKHTISEYAELLNKSPKTVSNLFSKRGAKTPLKYIQDRILLEARRHLFYTNKSVKEIAYDLGYDDIQSFSRFFKNQEGVSPSEFKEMSKLGTIANSSGNNT